MIGITTGRNALNGSIPSFFVSEPQTNTTGCRFSLNAFSKIGMHWIKKTPMNFTTSLESLKILSLCKCVQLYTNNASTFNF